MIFLSNLMLTMAAGMFIYAVAVLGGVPNVVAIHLASITGIMGGFASVRQLRRMRDDSTD